METHRVFAIYIAIFGIVDAYSHRLLEDRQSDRAIIGISELDKQDSGEALKPRHARGLPDQHRPFASPTRAEILLLREIQDGNRQMRRMYMPMQRITDEERKWQLQRQKAHRERIEREMRERERRRRVEIERAMKDHPANRRGRY